MWYLHKIPKLQNNKENGKNVKLYIKPLELTFVIDFYFNFYNRYRNHSFIIVNYGEGGTFLYWNTPYYFSLDFNGYSWSSPFRFVTHSPSLFNTRWPFEVLVFNLKYSFVGIIIIISFICKTYVLLIYTNT